MTLSGRLPHALQPFGGAPEAAGLGLSAELSFSGGAEILLRADYRLEGGLSRVRLPTGRSVAREDGLWEHTCFEAFLAAEGDERYWELNASPAGSWNFYRFERYREGMRREEGVTEVSVERAGAGLWRVQLRLGMVAPLATALARGGVRAGLAAVIEREDGKKTYWALAHAGPKADFHLRESFTLCPQAAVRGSKGNG
ncbi:MAG: DOMON-like domain-containing protein [Oligoflexia bacterium]|nr:DOMON-like domain-containing protein [Oligoflexia bacterium]